MYSFTTAVARTIRNLRARIGGPVDGSAVPRAEIDDVIAELETLNRGTEHDFLAVGEQLAGFQTLARRISADMTTLTELISGEHGRKASEALARMLDAATLMCDGSRASGEALASVQKISTRIRLGFFKLGETVAIIRALCPLTRIETSRLGVASAGFLDLSDEVTPLSDRIQSSGRIVIEASSLLEKCIQSGIRNGTEQSARRIQEVQSLIENVVESLRSFDQRQQRAREASVRHSGQHAAVVAAIDEMVCAIQFQDITRQQVEHVSEALANMRSGASRTGLRLQSSQLRVAGETFAKSIAQMESSLDNIAGRVREMAEAAQSLTGFSKDEHDSFFHRMEDCFARILEAAGSCASGQGAIQATVGELTTTMLAMRESVEEIRAIEIQIQRIALNATIRSAHIGAPGDALNVIAGVMHRVASDSSRNTEEVAGLLDSMSDASKSIAEGATDSLDTGGILAELRRAIADLHSSGRSSFAQVQQMARLGAELSESIGSARAELQVGPMFAQTIDQACGELDRIAAECAADSPASGVQHFEHRYTMQSERDVHHAIVRDSLGDNVDLF